MLSSPSSSDTNTEYTIKLGLPPLGIVFEDIGNGYPPEGVQVVALISGGKGQACGKIEIGDVLKVCCVARKVMMEILLILFGMMMNSIR